MTVQPDLCQTCSGTILLVFSQGGSYSVYYAIHLSGNYVQISVACFVLKLAFTTLLSLVGFILLVFLIQVGCLDRCYDFVVSCGHCGCDTL